MRLVAVVVIGVLLAGCSPLGIPGDETGDSGWDCPDPSTLSYDNDSDTYVEWRDCMPSPDRENEDCDQVNEDYVDWVNENCGFNYSVQVAY